MVGDIRYEKRHGSFYLIEQLARGGEDILNMIDEVAILFDAEDGTLYKHGAPDRVREYHTKLAKSGLAEDCVFLASKDWDPELLNKFMDCTGSVGVWWKQQQKLIPTADVTVIPAAAA
jgi:hypothetical protein